MTEKRLTEEQWNELREHLYSFADAEQVGFFFIQRVASETLKWLGYEIEKRQQVT